MLYGVRGSGEPPGLGVTVGEFSRSLSSFYARGTVGVVASRYPAVSVKYAALSYSYGTSVASGVQMMQQDMRKMFEDCRSSRIVVAGYSQGADVVRRALPTLQYPRPGSVGVSPFSMIAHVVLFGDPNFTAREEYTDATGARTHVRAVGDFEIGRQGLLRSDSNRYLAGTGLRRPPSFDGVGARWVSSYCHAYDPVCQSTNGTRTSLTTHFNYRVNDTETSAIFAARTMSDQQDSDPAVVRDLPFAYFGREPFSPRPGAVAARIDLTRVLPSTARAQDRVFVIQIDGRVVGRVNFPAGNIAGSYPAENPRNMNEVPIIAEGLRSGSSVVVTVRSGSIGTTDELRVRVQ